jgi:hypothetical protein
MAQRYVSGSPNVRPEALSDMVHYTGTLIIPVWSDRISATLPKGGWRFWVSPNVGSMHTN